MSCEKPWGVILLSSRSERTGSEGRQLNELINMLSLFTRQTYVEWIPELEKALGITEQRFLVMWELKLQPDCSLKDLASLLVVSPSSLSIMVNALVKQGSVQRIEDANDRRRVVLRLTEQGERELDVGEEHLVSKFDEYLNSLDEDIRQDLMTAADAMRNVMERILQRP